MKINPAAFHAYSKINDCTSIPRHLEVGAEDTVQRSGNTDQIQISPEGARKMEIEQLTKSIVSEMHEPASSERLERLRQAVQNRTYHIPTKDLVDAMMRHWCIA